jgi:hypothetical protein
VPLPRIAGHRDGDSTECPGDALYGELPGIRAAVLRLAPRPARATLALASSPPPSAQRTPAVPGGEPAGEVRTLVGGLQYLDGTPIAGAPIAVQARTVSRKVEVVHERTIAEAVTDAQGQWSLPATFPTAPSGGMWLRALCAGSSGVGATVSEPMRLAPSSLLSPPEAPAPTSPAAPPPAT